MTPAEVLRLSCDLGTLVEAVGQALLRAGLKEPEGEGAPFAGMPGSPSG